MTRHRRMPPTGSKIHRLWQCPASGVLPHNTNEDLDARSEPARGKGKGVHKFLETVRSVGVEAALAEVPAAILNLCRALDINKLPTHLSCEVAVAWNWKARTARELGRSPDLPYRPDDGGVDYDALGVDWSCEIPTTIDATGVQEFSPPGSMMDVVRRGYVGDYKTGFTKYPRPARFGQILVGAVCIRYLSSCDDVIGELLYIDDDGECFPQRDLIDAATLDAFEVEIADVMGDQPALEALVLANGPSAVSKHEGPHCAYCPAFKDCSAKTALIKAMPETLMQLGVKRSKDGAIDLVWVPKKDGKPDEGSWEIDLAPGAITIRNAAAVYEACERIEALCRRMRDEVCNMGYLEPIPLSDGRVIEPYETKRRSVDGRIAAAVLEGHYGRDKVLKKLDISITLSAIEDLVKESVDWNQKPRPVIKSKKGTGVYDRLLVEIEKAGGLFVNASKECKPHKPRGLKP